MRYYSTQRPIVPGAYPPGYPVDGVKNFKGKIYCEEIGRDAWGYIDFNGNIREMDATRYELIKAGTKRFWSVTSSVDDRGRIIAHITAAVEAESKPEDICRHTARKDIYVDWFDSQEAAEAFIKEAREC